MSDLAKALNDIRTVLDDPTQEYIRENGKIPYYEIQDPDWCFRNGHPYGLKPYKKGVVFKLDDVLYVVVQKLNGRIHTRNGSGEDFLIEWPEFVERINRNGNGIVLSVKFRSWKVYYTAKTVV